MKAKSCVLFCLAALAGPVARGALPITGPAVPGFEAYDRTIPALLDKWQVPGAALAVAYREKIVFARGYGYADRDTARPVQPDTSFRLMSISKTITAAMILKLVDEGRLSLSDHPFALLNYPTPTYSGARRDARLAQIEVRHLLNHSAGWVWDQAENPIVGGRGFYPTNYQRQIAALMGMAAPGTADTMIRYMVGQPMQAAPGTMFSYCAIGYLVLDRLIELKTGLTYEQAVQRFLAGANVSGAAIGGSRRGELATDEAVYYDYPGAPLVASNFDGALVAAPYSISLPGWEGAGGWKLSAIECLRFLLALDGQGETPGLLRAETVRDLRTAKYPSSYYGYGWYERYACSSGADQGHGGGAWGSKTWALRSADGAWHTVLLLNSLPGEALNGGAQFEADAYAALHALPASFSPAGVDLTRSTLGWEGWQHRYFGDGAWIATTDIDQDGFENLIEFGAALDPTRAEAVRAVEVASLTDGTSELTYRRLILEHALSWRVETSDDGRNWTAVSAVPSRTVHNAEGTLSVTVPLPRAAKVRLRVERPGNGMTATKEFALTGLGLPVITEHPVSRTLAAGGTASFSVTASAPLALRYQWMCDGQPVVGATDATFTQAAVTGAAAGDYTVVVSTAAGAVTSRLARLVVAAPEPGRLVNLSVRGTAGTGGEPLIVGFVMAGGGSKPVLLRAVGPGLIPLGVSTGAMANPRFDLHQGAGAADHVAATNDDWSAAAGDRERLLALFAELGAVPLEAGSRDAALVADVDGVRTVHVAGATAGARGVVLVEAYDAGAANSPRLVNVSARNHVDAGSEVLIAGFVINGNAPKRLLVRGVGPGLSAQGVTGALADPRLELHTRLHDRDAILATNDDWEAEPGVAEAAKQTGAFALAPGSRDAALLVTLPAGVYSAVVAGGGEATGEALVEVYEVE